MVTAIDAPVTEEMYPASWFPTTLRRATMREMCLEHLRAVYERQIRKYIPPAFFTYRQLTNEDFGQTGVIQVQKSRWTVAAGIYVHPLSVISLYGTYSPTDLITRVRIGRASGGEEPDSPKSRRRVLMVINHMEPYLGPGELWGNVFDSPLYYRDHTAVQFEVQGRIDGEAPDIRIDGIIGEPDGRWVTHDGARLEQ